METVLAKADAIFEKREAAWLWVFLGTPLERSTKDHVVALLRSHPFSVVTAPFTPHGVIGSGQHAYGAVACTISEEGCGEAQPLPAYHIPSSDRYNVAVMCLYFKHFGQCKQAYAGLGTDNGHFSIVSIVIRRHGVPLASRGEFFEQIAQVGVRLTVYRAAKLHPYFRGVVAAQHCTILYKGHFKALPGSGNCGTNA